MKYERILKYVSEADGSFALPLSFQQHLFIDYAYQSLLNRMPVVVDMVVVVLVAMLDPSRTALEHSNAVGHEDLAHHKAWGASPWVLMPTT